MEVSFLELRAKEVVNTQDGRRLGKVCDVVLCYPENRWVGIIVPGGRGFGMKKNTLFVDLKHIVKIGEDVILVDVGMPRGQKCAKRQEPRSPVFENAPPPQGWQNRNFEEYE